jgi:hypothetical protein
MNSSQMKMLALESDIHTIILAPPGSPRNLSDVFLPSLVQYTLLLLTIFAARSLISHYSNSLVSSLVDDATSFLSIPIYIYIYTNSYNNEKTKENFAKQKRCEVPHMLESRWPLGIDLVIRASTAAKNKRVMKFFCEIVDQAGDTFAWTALGSRVWATTNPENIEAILSTCAEGVFP